MNKQKQRRRKNTYLGVDGCVQTQISVNKKKQNKKLTGGKGWWAKRADLLHVWTRTGDVNALVLGHVACACGPVVCVCVCVWMRMGDVNALVLGHVACACRWIVCGRG